MGAARYNLNVEKDGLPRRANARSRVTLAMTVLGCRAAFFAGMALSIYLRKSTVFGEVWLAPFLLILGSDFLFLKGPMMTVSAAAASNAASHAYQTSHAAKGGNSGSSAFSAVANGADLLPGVSASGGSTLSSGMLSALLGMNSGGSSGTPAPNSATSGGTATGQHHHGLGAVVENLATTAATLVGAAAV